MSVIDEAGMAGAISRPWHARLRDRSRLNERAIALLLTILVHVLLLLALLLLKLTPVVHKVDDALKTFTVLPEPENDKGGAHEKEQVRQDTAKAADAQPVKAPPAPVSPTPPQPAPPTVKTPSFIELQSSEFASADIGRLPSGGGAQGAGKSSAKVQGPGEGPGGVQLYPVKWYRPPTSPELNGYLPSDPPRNGGWGEVACKTIEHYHVDNCQVLGESPLGSGFGKAVRLAAWQFLVVPPSIDGHLQVGTWVRIRIDYNFHTVSSPAGDAPGGYGPN